MQWTVQTNPPYINLQSSQEIQMLETQRMCGNIGKESQLDTQSRGLLFWLLSPGEYSDNAPNHTDLLSGHGEIWSRSGKTSLPSIAVLYICVVTRDGPPWICRVSHHTVQVVSASDKCFLINEECLFVTSVQNMLHETKRCRKFCKKKSHANRAVYKDNKQKNGKFYD
jgi:hypothetical protein